MKITVTSYVIENKKSCGYEKMRTVCRENSCTGCMACIGKCTKNAITIKDSMVAYNAVIDEDKCINCGMCEKVCPNNQVVEKRKPIDWKEGWTTENSVSFMEYDYPVQSLGDQALQNNQLKRKGRNTRITPIELR